MKCALVDGVGIKIESIWTDVGRAIFDRCMAMNDESAESLSLERNGSLTPRGLRERCCGPDEYGMDKERTFHEAHLSGRMRRKNG